MTLYVAVVDKQSTDFRSDRPLGDWAAFIDPDRDTAIRLALDARRAWTIASPGALIARYRVLVGELNGEVREPYEIAELVVPIAEDAS